MSIKKAEKLNDLVMDPSTYVNDTMRMLLQENHRPIFKGSVSSFKRLEEFLSQKTAIDIVFCEMYDHSNDIFEGMFKLRQLVKTTLV